MMPPRRMGSRSIHSNIPQPKASRSPCLSTIAVSSFHHTLVRDRCVSEPFAPLSSSCSCQLRQCRRRRVKHRKMTPALRQNPPARFQALTSLSFPWERAALQPYEHIVETKRAVLIPVVDPTKSGEKTRSSYVRDNRESEDPYTTLATAPVAACEIITLFYRQGASRVRRE